MPVQTNRSKARLVKPPARPTVGLSTWTSGSPATWLMWIRGPATSIRPGSTTSSMSVPSSAQAIRRSAIDEWWPPPATRTVSARVARQAATMSFEPPRIGTGGWSGTSPTWRSGTQAPTTV